MLFRRASRMAISPTATRAMIRAYSTRPWPDSSLEKACHSAFINFLPGRTASYGVAAHRGRAGAFEAGPARTHRGGMGREGPSNATRLVSGEQSGSGRKSHAPDS